MRVRCEIAQRRHRSRRTLHAEKLALVDAILTAPITEPETDWIEWTSVVDMSTREWQFTCAKAALGFGNRDPVVAKNHADGCAYFVAGVEPGQLVGVTVHDAATVENWLARYVAAGQPQWSVDYIDVQGEP